MRYRPRKAVALLKLVEDFTQQYHVARFSDMERSDKPPFLYTGTETGAWDFIKQQGDPDLVMVNDAGIQFPLPSTDSGASLVGQPPAASIANITPSAFD